MSTPTDRAAKAITDLVDRVGVKDATDKLVQLAKDMEADEARELAKRWAWWRSGGPDSLPKPKTTEGLHANVKTMAAKCVTSEERERLFAWVQAKVASIMRECGWAPGRRDDHIAARVYLSLWPHTIKAEGLANARALLDAAKAWPS